MRFLSPNLVRIYTKKVINVVPFDYMRYTLHVAHSYQFRPVQSRTILSCVRANRSDFRYSLEMKMHNFILWTFFSLLFQFSIFIVNVWIRFYVLNLMAISVHFGSWITIGFRPLFYQTLKCMFLNCEYDAITIPQTHLWTLEWTIIL